jgi:hypothetical protein
MKFIKTKIIFITLLFLTAQTQAFRFVVFSDTRSDGTLTQPFPENLFNKTVLDYINSQITGLSPRPDFAVFLGDAVVRGEPPIDPSITSNLQYWKDYETAALDGIKLYMTVGNCDLNNAHSEPQLDMQIAFAQIFNNMPDNGPTDPVDFRHIVYSFEYGQGDEKSLFVVLDSFGIYSAQGYDTVFADNDYDPFPYDTTPFTPEQITWFNNQASASTANHKFVFTHGPTFSVESSPLEGAPVSGKVKKIVDIAMDNKFDTLFCAHEHLFYRWNVGISAYPPASGTLIQNLTGTSGAPIDPPSTIHANKEGRIHFDYTYVVVDVEGNNIVEKSYSVTSDKLGNFSTHLIDTVLLVK